MVDSRTTRPERSPGPFAEGAGRYVPLPSREAAVRAVLQAVADRSPIVDVWGEAGIGKSLLLREVAARARGRDRKVVACPCGPDLVDTAAALAERLGVRTNQASEGWRAWERGLRLQAGLTSHVVLVMDEAQCLAGLDWSRLEGSGPTGLVTFLRANRGDDDRAERWRPSVHLAPLSYSEAERYLATKLVWWDKGPGVLAADVVARLHAWSAGVPRRLDRLAGQVLRRRDAPLTPAWVDEVASRVLALEN